MVGFALFTAAVEVAEGLFAKTYLVADEEIFTVYSVLIAVLAAAAAAPVAAVELTDEILAASSAIFDPILLSVMTALITFYALSWFNRSKIVPGKYLGIPIKDRALTFLKIKGMIRWVEAEIAQ